MILVCRFNASIVFPGPGGWSDAQHQFVALKPVACTLDVPHKTAYGFEIALVRRGPSDKIPAYLMNKPQQAELS